MAAVIAQIEQGSLAEEAGLKAGDVIQTINGIEIIDYLDYMYASCNEEVEIILSDRSVTIENEEYEPLGIEFQTMLIDKPKACHNKCVFCFIDQLPDGMRETCYFKDDDYRLSFLQGNYVSLTNMKDEDVERLIEYHIPRINISIHTTNPELRCRMLHNKRAGDVLEYLKRFAEAGLNMNGQIVLCPGFNDGPELDRTLGDLAQFGDSMESVSIVPVGLSAHRKGLAPLRKFDEVSARLVIEQVERWQKRFKEEIGSNYVFLGDEFYIMADVPLPDYDSYEGFPQIENGVGLCSSMIYEFEDALDSREDRMPVTKKAVATGVLAFDMIQGLANKLDGGRIQVYPVVNHYFGEDITVTGLITGGDLIAQLRDKPLGEALVISNAMLRHDEPVFLDNVTVGDVERELDIKVLVVPNDGYELLDALMG